MISFRIDWFDLLAVQGALKSLLQHHSSKASILRRVDRRWQRLYKQTFGPDYVDRQSDETMWERIFEELTALISRVN